MEKEGGVMEMDIGQLNSVDMQVARVLKNVLLVAQSNKVQCCLHNHTARKELSQSELSLSLQWAGMCLFMLY